MNTRTRPLVRLSLVGVLLSACTPTQRDAATDLEPTDSVTDATDLGTDSPDSPPHRWIFIGYGAPDVLDIEADGNGWTPIGAGWPDVQLFSDVATAREYLYPRTLIFSPVDSFHPGRPVDDVLGRFDETTERLLVVWNPGGSTTTFRYLKDIRGSVEASISATIVKVSPDELSSTVIVPWVMVLAVAGTHWIDADLAALDVGEPCRGSAPADCDLPDEDFYFGEDPFPSDWDR
jgi:hypothetical protein